MNCRQPGVIRQPVSVTLLTVMAEPNENQSHSGHDAAGASGEGLSLQPSLGSNSAVSAVDAATGAALDSGTLQPPSHLWQMVRFAGPGMIVAGSIVGSGELIATTLTGAEAGFSLLWLIILGCLVKVFVQVELGRYALISGKTTLAALAEVPGPRMAKRGNWLVWYWFVMWLASISQLGGIAGGVGEALAISVPITAMGRDFNDMADARVEAELLRSMSRGENIEPLQEAIQRAESLEASYSEKYSRRVGEQTRVQSPADVVLWASLIAAVTSVLLVLGRYGLVQATSTILVGGFTLVVIVNLFLLQRQPTWRVTGAEFWSGLSFGLPAEVAGVNPIRTALATFGIIGVGAAELITYPYWCLEKGYARFTGVNDQSLGWRDRAAGWMRVMRVDAWGSMFVYTFSTVAFYLLGAAVLNRSGLVPSSGDLIRTLSVMFVPVFSDWASTVFLVGAFAVLYSTFFVANAAHARVFSDALRVMGLIADDEETRAKWITRLSGMFPVLCLVIYLLFPNPAKLVLISGVTQGIMLPMLAGAALYFRYRRIVPGLVPGTWWDAFLWLSALAMLLTGGWTVYKEVF